MSSSLPLYYAGVASDDDALEEMLSKDRKLEHGFSSTMDLHVQRLLGVSYHQVSLSKVKKVTIAGITIVAIILFFSLSFHSANKTKNREAAYEATSQANTTPVTMTPSQPITQVRPHVRVPLQKSETKAGEEKEEKKKEEKRQEAITTVKTTPAKQKFIAHTTQSTPQQKLKTTQGKPRPILSYKHKHINHQQESLNNIPLTVQPHRHVNSEFVLAMNPSIPVELNLKCRTCALVTNSADLLSSNAGSVIDSSDCVIRLNTAPTAGFELDVGGKTTVRIVSQRSLGDLLHYIWREPQEMRDLSYIIVYGTRNALCRNCTFFKMFKKVSGEYLGDKFLRFAKAYDGNLRNGEIIRATEGSEHSRLTARLSTRFHGLRMMHKVCEKMRVFGAEHNHPCLSGRSYSKSYWQRDEVITCDGSREAVLRDIRRYRLEEGIFEDWADKYDLEFLYP